MPNHFEDDTVDSDMLFFKTLTFTYQTLQILYQQEKVEHEAQQDPKKYINPVITTGLVRVKAGY